MIAKQKIPAPTISQGTPGTPGTPGTLGIPNKRTSASASSFAGHYGHLIVSEGVAPIPRALFQYQGALGLAPQQVWFVACVLAHKWDGGLPHPSLQEIARQATLGVRQVKKIKSSIVQAGLLEVVPRYGAEGEQDANSYDFGPLFEQLERIISTDLPAQTDELAEDGSKAGLLSARSLDISSGVTSPDLPNAATPPYTERESRDHSFAARFGRILLRCGIAAVPRALFTFQSTLGISPQQMWFVIYILSFQWSTELPYPSLRKMALKTGSSERQIHRIKDSLVDAGYLRLIERHAADGADSTSAYDFTALLKAVSSLIRADRAPATKGPDRDAGGRSAAGAVSSGSNGGGELYVSGGVNRVSVAGEPCVSEGVNCTSERGVNRVSVAGVNCTSYELESVKEEALKQEPQQQQARDLNEEEAQAYYGLVDVGVIPSIAFDLATATDPELVLAWVRYYLAILSTQEHLSNPLGVLVKRLRSGEDPPLVPSPGDLQSLRLRMSRYVSS